MSDDARFFGVAGVGLLVLLACLLLITRAAGYMELPGAVAKIEQLRADVWAVDLLASEDVLGQVTEWNQTILSNQRYNRIWWAGWMIPDEWEAVQPISVRGASQ